MMVKFNNAHENHRGNVIWLNTDCIVAVFEEATIQGGSLSTKIFGVTGTHWTVEESVNQVIDIINKPTMLVE